MSILVLVQDLFVLKDRGLHAFFEFIFEFIFGLIFVKIFVETFFCVRLKSAIDVV